ncbi:MAG: hypothetical protein WCL23_01485 [Candidatus Moraniibacteriota bacterium]
MKTILVDAAFTFTIDSESGFHIFQELHDLLDTFPNPKIILTNANDEQLLKFGIVDMPYPVFSLKHEPDKVVPEYFVIMLDHFNLKPEDIVYFEHDLNAVRSAESVGITSYHYDADKKDLVSLRNFLEHNV